MVQVKLYTSSICPHCTVVREFLKKNGIEFDEYDVEDDEEQWKEALSKTKGLDVVPVVDIDGEVFFGEFNEELERRLIDALGLG